jgi:hypothetical protein
MESPSTPLRAVVRIFFMVHLGCRPLRRRGEGSAKRSCQPGRGEPPLLNLSCDPHRGSRGGATAPQRDD